MSYLELNKTISLIKNSFQTIDFRAAYYKHNDKWEYIVSSFRFTNKTKNEVSSLQKRLENSIKTTNFKIKFKALEIQDFEEYLNKIGESAELTLKKINNDSIDKVLNNVKAGPTSRYLLDYDKEYNSIQFTIEFKDLNIKHHERFQYIKNDLISIGRKDFYILIEQALQIQNFSLNSPLYSIILLPIYVKIENLTFVNNYLSGDVIFHTLYEDCKLHFILSYLKEKSDEHKEFTLSTDREKIKWYRYKNLSDNMFKIHFTVHFEKFRLKPFPESYRLICRLSSSDFDDFLMDFYAYLREIHENIKNIELIPVSLLEIINPFLEINTLDRMNANKQSTDIIEEFVNNRINELKKIFLENIDWLMSYETVRLMKEFFIGAANRPASHYNNYFADLIINTCIKLIESETLEDINTKSIFNNLLISYNYNKFFQSKLYYYGKRLAELREEIKLLLDEVFEVYPQVIVHSNINGRGRISLDYPNLWSEIELNLPDSYLFCKVLIYRNNSSIFNYHVLHVLIYRTSKPEQIWEKITSGQKEKLTQFLNRLSDIPNLDVIEYNLPTSITSRLKKSIDIIEVSKSDLYLKDKKKFKIINSDMDSKYLQYSDLNIFIGKNNTGKTFSLTECFTDILNSQTFDNQLALEEFHQNYSQFYTYELYYIPHKREIDEPIGRKPDLKEGLINVLNNLRNLMTENYLKDEPTDIENRNNEIPSVSWKIPNFLEIIDIFSIDLTQTDSLVREDKEIVDRGRHLFLKFNEIWENWKKKVEFFFEEIEVKEVEDLGRGGRHKITFYDKYVGKNITNWKSFGSGTQELLNLIFIIEFLKLSPAIIYESLLEALNSGNIGQAFDQYIKDIYSNRIIFIDEPEVSLHPSLQRKFFNYLNESSQTIQIFIATQSPFFLDINNFNDLLGNVIFVTLCIKEVTGQFIRKKITKENKIQIIDEIFNYNPLETAFYLSKNNFYDLIINDDKRDFQLHTLNMIDKLLSERKKYDPEYRNLLNLGTFDEDYKTRLLQNAIFLSKEPAIINLNDKNNVIHECQKIFLYQLHNNEFKSSEKMRFRATCASHWNLKTCVKSKVLSYKEEKANELSLRIMEKLNNLENEEKEILRHRSILVFPENTLPYQIMSSLISFAKERNFIIIGGMETLKFNKIKQYYDIFNKEYPDDFIKHFDLKNIVSNPKIEDNTFINQAVIINSNGKFSFQIKNIPVSKLGEKNEGIPIIPIPKFFKFETSVGSLAVFICKDFLVNYEVIDKWMDKNSIKTILVPSFTKLVNPFIYKFGNIIRKRYNRDKTIAFVNIAEYGGSGIFNLSYQREYEPGKKSLFKEQEEECKPFRKDFSLNEN